MERPIVLLSDFGLDDPYVGQVKALLLGLAPASPVLDLGHNVRPHDLLQGGFFLAASLPFLPGNAVVMALVDPGVGTSRRVVGLEVAGRTVLAPDNGLLTLVLDRFTPSRAWDFRFPDLPVPSATFHGRDRIAPLAARLARGESPEGLGSRVPLESLVRLLVRGPALKGDRIEASVLHVDRFGNVVLDLVVEKWTQMVWAAPEVILVGQSPRPLCRVRTYAEIPPGAWGILAGSQGYLELAQDRGSLALATGLKAGQSCVLELKGSDLDRAAVSA